MDKSINILILGLPCSGKTTQCNIIARDLDFFHLETGALLRSEVRENSSLGKVVEGYMKKAELVPDKLILDIIGENINKHIGKGGIIFDGFPKNINQAEILDKMLYRMGSRVHFVFLLKTDEEKVKNRMLEYRKDHPEMEFENSSSLVIKRIHEEKKLLEDLVSFYKKKNILFEFDGTLSDMNIASGIETVINQKMNV